jgi:hypothetical protein
MSEVDTGGHPLLDESVIMFGSELSHPPTHQKTNLPLLLAGRGGLRPFGDPKHCTGPLSNIV